MLYSISVLLVAWFTSWRLGLALAFLSPTMLLLVRLFAGDSYSHWAYYVLNPLLKFCILAIFVYWVHKSKIYIARINELARNDSLTEAINRRFFMELMQGEIDRSQRHKHPFTLAYDDLDNFKTVNDQFGHSVGDRVLQTIVAYIKNNPRKVDVVARLGGDEFALLLSEIGKEQARIVISKIRQGLLDEMQNNGWQITFSIGVLTCMDTPYTVEGIVTMVDKLWHGSI